MFNKELLGWVKSVNSDSLSKIGIFVILFDNFDKFSIWIISRSIFELLYFMWWDDDYRILSCWLYDVTNESSVLVDLSNMDELLSSFANMFNSYEELAKVYVLSKLYVK